MNVLTIVYICDQCRKPMDPFKERISRTALDDVPGPPAGVSALCRVRERGVSRHACLILQARGRLSREEEVSMGVQIPILSRPSGLGQYTVGPAQGRPHDAA